MSTKRKVTLATKIDIVNSLETGSSIRVTAAAFNVSRSVVKCCKKQKTQLTDLAKNSVGQVPPSNSRI